MSNKGWDKVESDIESGPMGLFKWITIAVILLTLLIGGVSWITMPAEKVVERVVFKESFQYKEGMEQRAAILKSNIAQIDADMISHPEKYDQLLAQRKVFEAQLNAITINQ